MRPCASVRGSRRALAPQKCSYVSYQLVVAPRPRTYIAVGAAPAGDAAAAPAAVPAPAAPAAPPAAEGPAPQKQQQQQASGSTIDWQAKRRKRLVEDIAQGGRCALGPAYGDEAAIASGVASLEALIPGFQIDLERLKAADWARLVLDPNGAAIRLVALKGFYPGADLSKILMEKPGLLLQGVSVLEENAAQVHSLLERAKDRDALLTALPMLLEPKTLISVLVTVEKWYRAKKRDPIEVLEADPDLVRRAEACDIPFEPVYTDSETGQLMAPSLRYHERRTQWQAYIDKTFYGQP